MENGGIKWWKREGEEKTLLNECEKTLLNECEKNVGKKINVGKKDWEQK